MATVFINYRRDQTSGEARALFNDLSTILGEDFVFMDVDNIALGRDFREVISERLASCDLMLALVGRDWLDAQNASGQRRLDDASDFVRLEIATALKRNVPVTPVLLQGAQMPSAEQLPEEISDFAFRNGFELSHNRWASDVHELVRRLNLTTDDEPGSAAAPSNSGAQHAPVPAEKASSDTAYSVSDQAAAAKPNRRLGSAMLVIVAAVLLGLGALFFLGDGTIDFVDDPSDGERRDILSFICPVGFEGCSESNLCSSCFQNCSYCQNLDSDICGPEDCMSCKPGYSLVQIYTDGTGRCVPD